MPSHFSPRARARKSQQPLRIAAMAAFSAGALVYKCAAQRELSDDWRVRRQEWEIGNRGTENDCPTLVSQWGTESADKVAGGCRESSKRSQSLHSPERPGNQEAADVDRAAKPDPRESPRSAEQVRRKVPKATVTSVTSSADSDSEESVRSQQATGSGKSPRRPPAAASPVRTVRMRECLAPVPPIGNYPLRQIPLDSASGHLGSSTV